MNQEKSVNFEEIAQIEALQFISKELFEKKQLKTIDMFGGKGGFGSVLFVEDIKISSQKYAIKAQSIINNVTGQISQNSLQMCKHEAEVMRNCKHKNIVEIHSDYEIGLYHLIQMNLCQCSLDNWIQNNKQTQISDIAFLNLTYQILDGLEFLHNMDYVLRDLSVKNVLLTTDGVIKLCDFGFAKKYDDAFKSKVLYTQGAKGVLFYFPPELIEDITNNKVQIKQTKKGDIWAFGVCLSLIGGAQITEYYAHVLNKNYQIPLSPNISQKANSLIQFILNKNPLERPTILQIQQKISDLFALDQSQIIGENVLNLKFDQNLQNQNLNNISSNQQIEYQVKQQNLSVFQSNSNEQKNIYKENYSSSTKVNRMIEFQFINANELLLQYETLLHTNSENNDILITLGFIEAQYNSNIYKAQQYFNKVIELSPNDLDAYLGLCECVISMRERQNYQQYIEQLNNQINSNNQYWRLYYYLSYFYYLDFQQYKSEQCIDKALELNQNSPLILSLQALILFKKNKNKEEAELLLQKSTDLNQDSLLDIELRRVLFQIKFIKDQTVTISKIKQLIDKGVKQLILYVNLLELYYQIQNETQFIIYKNLLLENYSKCYLIYEYLGNFEKDKKLKIYYYTKSVEIFPFNYYCIYQLESLIDQNDYQKIIQCYQKILEINPNNTKLCFKIGNIYKNMAKNDEKALEFYNKVVLLNPKHINALFEIAQLYYKKKQKYQALKIYYKITEIDGSNYIYYSYIGQIESELRCHQNSIKAYEKAMQIQDKDYFIQKILSHEYIENEQFQSAIRLLLSMIDNFKQYESECLYLLGKAEYRSKNYKSALSYFERCLDHKNKNNEFEAQVYHIKCQVRLKQISFFSDLKYKNIVDGFFSFLYYIDAKGQQQVIEDKYLNKKQILYQLDLFIIAETLFDFNVYDSSIKFFQKLIEIDTFNKIDQKNVDIYYYLGKMENLNLKKKQLYYMKYIKVFSRDDKIIRYLAENCLDSEDKAIYYEQLVDIDSKDIKSIENLCLIYESKKEQNELFNWIENLLKVDKNNKYGLIKIIENLTNNSDLQDQDHYFNNYIVPQQNSVQIIFEFAKDDNVSIQQKLKCYQLILKIDQENTKALELLVYYYKKIFDQEKYFKALEDLLKIDKNNSCAIEELIQVIINEEGDKKQQQYYFQHHILFYEQNTTIILKFANETHISEQKLKYYKLIMNIEPNNIQVLEKISNLCKEMKLFDEQENNLITILKIDSQNKFAIIELADFYYYHLKDTEKAILYYEKYLLLDKDNLKIIKILGQIYFEKEKYQESKNMYEQSILIEPKSSETLFKLGEIDFQLKNYDQSNKNYIKADNIDSKNANISYNMAVNYYITDDFENSIKNFFKCFSKDKNHSKSYFMIGDIYQYKLKKKEESIAYYRKAIECNDVFEDAHYNLGEAFIELNYAHEAVNSFKQLLKINPEYKNSQRCKDYILENEEVEIKQYKKTSIESSCNIF